MDDNKDSISMMDDAGAKADCSRRGFVAGVLSFMGLFWSRAAGGLAAPVSLKEASYYQVLEDERTVK